MYRYNTIFYIKANKIVMFYCHSSAGHFVTYFQTTTVL